MAEPWCVMSIERGPRMEVTRERWCRLKSQPKPGREPREGAASRATACGHHVIFPCGFERREPDCEECNG